MGGEFTYQNGIPKRFGQPQPCAKLSCPDLPGWNFPYAPYLVFQAVLHRGWLISGSRGSPLVFVRLGGKRLTARNQKAASTAFPLRELPARKRNCQFGDSLATVSCRIWKKKDHVSAAFTYRTRVQSPQWGWGWRPLQKYSRRRRQTKQMTQIKLPIPDKSEAPQTTRFEHAKYAHRPRASTCCIQIMCFFSPTPGLGSPGRRNRAWRGCRGRPHDSIKAPRERPVYLLSNPCVKGWQGPESEGGAPHGLVLLGFAPPQRGVNLRLQIPGLWQVLARSAQAIQVQEPAIRASALALASGTSCDGFVSRFQKKGKWTENPQHANSVTQIRLQATTEIQI